jgi:hypothetical protein
MLRSSCGTTQDTMQTPPRLCLRRGLLRAKPVMTLVAQHASHSVSVHPGGRAHAMAVCTPRGRLDWRPRGDCSAERALVHKGGGTPRCVKAPRPRTALPAGMQAPLSLSNRSPVPAVSSHHMCVWLARHSRRGMLRPAVVPAAPPNVRNRCIGSVCGHGECPSCVASLANSQTANLRERRCRHLQHSHLLMRVEPVTPSPRGQHASSVPIDGLEELGGLPNRLRNSQHVVPAAPASCR